MDSVRGDRGEKPSSRCDVPGTRRLLLSGVAFCLNPCLGGEAVLSSLGR